MYANSINQLCINFWLRREILTYFEVESLVLKESIGKSHYFYPQKIIFVKIGRNRVKFLVTIFFVND